MTRFTKFFLLPLLLLLCASFAYSQKATVIIETANLRDKPNGKVVAHFGYGEEINIIRKRGVWYLVQVASVKGWVHGNGIRFNKDMDAHIDGAPLRGIQYFKDSRGRCYYFDYVPNGKKLVKGKKIFVEDGFCEN